MEEKKQKNKLFLVISIILYVIGSLGVLSCFSSMLACSSNGIGIEQKIRIINTEMTGMNQFQLTIVGSIKNNSNKELPNVTLNVLAEFVDNEESLYIEIGTMAPGEVRSINKTIQTNRLLTQVKKVTCITSDGSYELNNIITTRGGVISRIFLFCLFAIVFCVATVFMRLYKNGTSKIITSFKDFNASLQQLGQPSKPKKIACPYCGVKNKEDAERCSGCGARLG